MSPKSSAFQFRHQGGKKITTVRLRKKKTEFRVRSAQTQAITRFARGNRQNPFVFIITDKAKLVGEEVKGVGVMRDEELKLRKLKPLTH